MPTFPYNLDSELHWSNRCKFGSKSDTGVGSCRRGLTVRDVSPKRKWNKISPFGVLFLTGGINRLSSEPLAFPRGVTHVATCDDESNSGELTINPPVMNNRQAAAYVAHTTHALEAWRRLTRLAGKQVGPEYLTTHCGQIRYRKTALDAWLASLPNSNPNGKVK